MTLIAQIVRFARRNIQIYDAQVVDLYQWVCAQYLVLHQATGERQIAVAPLSLIGVQARPFPG
jgi:hypothetical protein